MWGGGWGDEENEKRYRRGNVAVGRGDEENEKRHRGGNVAVGRGG